MEGDKWVEIQIPEQKLYENGAIPFPAVVSPPIPSKPQRSLSEFTEAIESQRQHVQALLRRSGAVLFRGFAVNSAADFNAVVESFGFDELPYVGGAAPRTNVLGRVFTSNESPPDQKIPFHHEMAQVPEFPSKVFFFCEVEPGSGGETPIVMSHVVYERMREKHPDFVARLERHGLIYTRVLGEGDDPSSPIGRGWKSTFLTSDKAVAEQRLVGLTLTGQLKRKGVSESVGDRAGELGVKLEWTEEGVKTVTGPIAAIKLDEARGRKVWFNSMVAAYTGWRDSRNDPVKAVTFADGNPLPAHVILDCLAILERESVAFPWRKGDVLLLDNIAVQHSRSSFTPPRRILASLAK